MPSQEVVAKALKVGRGPQKIFFPPLTSTDLDHQDVYEARVERATLLQQYSRQQAGPATNKGSDVITLCVWFPLSPTSLSRLATPTKTGGSELTNRGCAYRSVTEFQDYNCNYAGAKEWVARKTV